MLNGNWHAWCNLIIVRTALLLSMGSSHARSLHTYMSEAGGHLTHQGPCQLIRSTNQYHWQWLCLKALWLPLSRLGKKATSLYITFHRDTTRDPRGPGMLLPPNLLLPQWRSALEKVTLGSRELWPKSLRCLLERIRSFLFATLTLLHVSGLL